MKILKKYKSLLVMSCAAFALFLVSVSNSFAAVSNVGTTDAVAYESSTGELNAETAARLSFLLRAGKAVVRAGAYAAGAVVGFVEGVVTGANGGEPQETIANLMEGTTYDRYDLTTFDQ